MIAALTPALVADIHAQPWAFATPRQPRLAFAVHAPGIGKAAELAFRGAILQASGARAATTTDSSIFRVSVDNFAVDGDSAVVDIDRGDRWCYAGSGGSSGTEYRYYLVRSTSGWRYLRSGVEAYYDPPPPPPPGTQPRGCPKDLRDIAG